MSTRSLWSFLWGMYGATILFLQENDCFRFFNVKHFHVTYCYWNFHHFANRNVRLEHIKTRRAQQRTCASLVPLRNFHIGLCTHMFEVVPTSYLIVPFVYLSMRSGLAADAKSLAYKGWCIWMLKSAIPVLAAKLYQSFLVCRFWQEHIALKYFV